MRSRLPLLWALVLLAGFLVHEYRRGADSYVRINDHLDGAVPLYAVMARTQPILGGLHDRVDAIFDGISRNSLPSTLNPGVLLYYGLDPFWAHLANEAVMRVLALVGMFLLLRRHLLPEADEGVVAAAALCFALLPFLPTGYLSVAGQPFLLHAILDLRAGRGSPANWLWIGLFSVYSSLIFIGLFVLLFLTLLVVHDWVRHRRPSGALVLAGALMAALYLGSEYRLLYQTFFDTDHVSHRSAFVRPQGSLRHVALTSADAFFLNHRHAPSLQSPFLLLAVSGGLCLGWIDLRRRALTRREALAFVLCGRNTTGSRWRDLATALSLCGVASLLVGLWSWTSVQDFVDHPALGLIRMFNFHRIQWFQPLLFGLTLAFALHQIAPRPKWGHGLALGLVGAQMLWALANSNGAVARRESGLTFRAYYSAPLFADIQAHLGRPPSAYRVVSLGLPPGIALYHGFFVLDGFVNDYPLEYKQRFRRVIARELDKDPRMRTLFDNWGGHLDLFSSELGKVSGYNHRVYAKDSSTRAVEDLDIDVRALRELGADYILSAVEILNHEALGLVFEETFQRRDSAWRILLYRVPDGGATEGSRGDPTPS